MTHTKSLQQHNYEQYLVFVLCGISAIFIIGYAYFLNASVLYVVQRENIEQEIALVGSDVSDLERKYLTLSETINLDLAYSLGFKEANETRFASRRSLFSDILTLNLDI